MKKTNLMKAIFPFAALSLLAFAGCDTPTTSSGDISYVTDDDATNSTPSADTSKNTDTEEQRNNGSSDSNNTNTNGGTNTNTNTNNNTNTNTTTYSNTVDVELASDYVRGFDASYVYGIENSGSKYYETDGTETDFFTILKNHGVNTVRLRTWVDPENAEKNGIVSNDSSWAKSGLNTTAKTVALAKRAKDAGLKVLLDFHYSDYWADPSKQIIPYAWQSCTTADEIATKLSDYTKEVLQALKDASVTPDYVQVGNEIDSGMLMHTSYNGSKTTDAADAIKGTLGTEAFNKYLAAGCQAVRDFDPSIKIIIHITNRKPTDLMETISKATTNYDIIGLSYYPWESSHGTISSLRSNVTNLKSVYNKDVMVVESSMYWNYGSYDSNYWDLSQAAQHLVDPDTNAIYSDMTTATVTYNGSDTTIVEGSVNNQMASFKHIIEESAECGATGIFAWGGDMLGEWKYSFFDGNGKAMSSLDVFNVAYSSASEAKTLLEETSIPSDTPSSGTPKELVSASAMPSSASSITFTYKAGTSDSLTSETSWITLYSDTSWKNPTKLLDSWVSDFDSTASSFSVTVTDATVISAFISGGVWIAADSSNYTGTISITYVE